MAVTMKDIARNMGVSIATVSKVLRNEGNISAKTRERVLKRAKELNYKPNWVAQSLVTRRTHMIGVVVPSLGHPFFSDVARALAAMTQPEGYHLVIASSDEDPALEKREIEVLLARQVDALVVASSLPASDEDFFRGVAKRSVPFVLIDRSFPRVQANYVGSDDEQIGAIATGHLIECGRRRIAHIRGFETSTGIGRLKGYHKALARHRLEAADGYVVYGRSSDADPGQSGYEAMRKLLALRPRPDGVFCYNDPTAAGAIRAILEGGLNIPEDIAVIGAGNMRYSDLLLVPLTTIDQCSSLMGERAGELVLRLAKSKRPSAKETSIIPPVLIPRASTIGRADYAGTKRTGTRG